METQWSRKSCSKFVREDKADSVASVICLQKAKLKIRKPVRLQRQAKPNKESEVTKVSSAMGATHDYAIVLPYALICVTQPITFEKQL
jgi:hypothetical protein